MRKIHIKRLAVMMAAVLIIAAMAGCSKAASLARPTPDPSASTSPVTGSCSISRDGDVITVSGTTDIMNGAWIDVSVVAQNGMIIDHHTIQKTQDEISEQFTVTEEKYGDVIDMQGYICCAPSYYHSQPSEVYAAYGKKFQNITAADENVIWNNEGVVLTFASDWLNGVVPSPTAGPTPTPTATPDSASAASVEATATPSV